MYCNILAGSKKLLSKPTVFSTGSDCDCASKGYSPPHSGKSLKRKSKTPRPGTKESD